MNRLHIGSKKLLREDLRGALTTLVSATSWDMELTGIGIKHKSSTKRELTKGSSNLFTTWDTYTFNQRCRILRLKPESRIHSSRNQQTSSASASSRLRAFMEIQTSNSKSETNSCSPIAILTLVSCTNSAMELKLTVRLP